MRRVELLIEQSRRATESTNFSEEAGIQDAEFIQYLNDAQERIYSHILRVYPDDYLTEAELDATSGTGSYGIPVDAYLGTRLKMVEYSPNGQATQYYTLEKGVLKERFNGNTGSPSEYIRRGKQILLQPAPNTNGKIRLNYFQKLPALDKRRGAISAVVLDSGTRTITSLTIDITSISATDITDLQNLGYICAVDKDGNIKMKSIPISAIDSDTGVVTLDGAFTYESDETLAVGNYVVMGKYATTHCQLDDSCERYLIAHTDWKVLKRDSSSDSQEQNDELKDMIMEIVESYKDADEDVSFIPILDAEYLEFN